MRHYTLNTGHSRECPRIEVADDVLPVVRPLLTPGRHSVPGVIGGYELAVPISPAGWLGTVYQANAPVATIGVASNNSEAAIIWPALLDLYQPDQPWYSKPAEMPQVPWCAVVLHLTSPAYEWLGDFERCLAWAWIERR